MALNGGVKSTWLDDDDDVDDEMFLRNSRKAANTQPIGREIAQLSAQKESIESRTLQSTERSLSLLRESEHVGVETAKELATQREQLERTSRNLDSINATLRTTQRNIDGIKSIFSSFKNYLTGPKDVPKDLSKPNVSVNMASPSSSKIEQTDIPRVREEQKMEIPPSTAQQRIDYNLSLMSNNVCNLRGLALNLGDEILEQNEIIDKMQDKADKAGLTINKQNTQMNRLLGKK